MPEITERVGETLGRKVGPLPLGGWAAIGIGTIVVVKLLRGGGGGKSDTVTIPDAFSGEGGAGIGGSGTTIPVSSPPAGSGSTATPGAVRIQIIGDTHVYDVLGKLLGIIHKGSTIYNATKVTVSGKAYYKFKAASGNYRLVPVQATSVRVVP